MIFEGPSNFVEDSGVALHSGVPACRRHVELLDVDTSGSSEYGCLGAATARFQGFCLSFFAMVTAALLRLLLHGFQLSGGAYNVDPLIRGGRSIARGAFRTFLRVACATQPIAAIPGANPAGFQSAAVAAAVQRMNRFDLEQQLARGVEDAGAWVEHSAQHAAQIDYAMERLEAANNLLDEASHLETCGCASFHVWQGGPVYFGLVTRRLHGASGSLCCGRGFASGTVDVAIRVVGQA